MVGKKDSRREMQAAYVFKDQGWPEVHEDMKRNDMVPEARKEQRGAKRRLWLRPGCEETEKNDKKRSKKMAGAKGL